MDKYHKYEDNPLQKDICIILIPWSHITNIPMKKGGKNVIGRIPTVSFFIAFYQSIFHIPEWFNIEKKSKQRAQKGRVKTGPFSLTTRNLSDIPGNRKKREGDIFLGGGAWILEWPFDHQI